MSRTENLILAFAMIVVISLCGCNDQPATNARTITLDPSTKITNQLRTEYNPVILSKECADASLIKIQVPKPYPYNLSGKDRIHFVHVFLDAIEIGVIPIDDNFTVTKNETEFHTGYQIVDFGMPIYSEKINESGTLTLKLISDDELITTYSTKYRYLGNDQKAEVIRRNDVKSMNYAGPLSIKEAHIEYRIDQPGSFRDDLNFTHEIKKMDDHYLSTYTAKGEHLYRQLNENDDWKKVMEIPDLPTLVSKVPLAFELEEKSLNYQTITTSLVDEDDIGKKVIFDSYKEVLGSQLTVQFKDCEMLTSEEEEVYMQVHSGFNLK